MSHAPGDTVLVRATVSQDGRHVLIAPGVELVAQSVDIITKKSVVLFFESEAEADEFIEVFAEHDGIEPVKI